VLYGGADGDGLAGNAGNDQIFGGDGADSLSGDEGDDLLSGAADDDLMLGGAGTDTLYGGAGNDQMDGGAGNDVLDGGAGGDTLYGGAGNDTYVVDNADDRAFENAGDGDLGGIDRVNASITYTLGDYIENLALQGKAAIDGTGNELNNWMFGNTAVNVLSGAGGDDLIYGGAGNDTIFGGDGADTLAGDAGNDSLSGGWGDDTYVVDSLKDVVSEGFGQGTDRVNASISYTLAENVEKLWLLGTDNINGSGNGLNNALHGNDGNNVLSALLGDDTLYGGGGNDTLDGGAGNDILTGGMGADNFVFATNGGVDHITDFKTGVDHIQIAASLVSLLGGAGALTRDAFWASTTGQAHDANDRLIYNTKTGALYYDKDGDGTQAAVQIAVLDQLPGSGATLTYADFIFG